MFPGFTPGQTVDNRPSLTEARVHRFYAFPWPVSEVSEFRSTHDVSLPRRGMPFLDDQDSLNLLPTQASHFPPLSLVEEENSISSPFLRTVRSLYIARPQARAQIKVSPPFLASHRLEAAPPIVPFSWPRHYVWRDSLRVTMRLFALNTVFIFPVLAATSEFSLSYITFPVHLFTRPSSPSPSTRTATPLIFDIPRVKLAPSIRIYCSGPECLRLICLRTLMFRCDPHACLPCV